jgi:hypothetical protein
MQRVNGFLAAAFFFFIIIIPCLSYADESNIQKPVHHSLRVLLYPQEHRLTVEDIITLPDTYPSEIRFSLHKGMNPVAQTPGAAIVSDNKNPEGMHNESYRVFLPSGLKNFKMTYGGTLYHPIESSEKEQARGFSQTPGIISGDGVFLSGGSFWYPVFDTGLLTFFLHIELPPGWDAISQGERVIHTKTSDSARVSYESPEPQDEIYIVASEFTEYTKQAGQVTALVYLRNPDAQLAGQYLNATVQYISMYDNLIGRYPYKKFALVENFWETGFGMPSFTLLGPKVIRFPFIINSSFPHEILHNWWGNSVFPDYTKGNWAEGLTAYLSDHLIKEQLGNAGEYRQTTLQKYSDYVSGNRDFPVSEFRIRHSSASEAVGYGKSLMFFHMLRQELGDSAFVSGLQDFYRANRFRIASFDDIRKSFEKASGKDLRLAFDKWITRAGAPELNLRDVSAKNNGNGFILTGVIEQTQSEKPYHLRIPVAVTLQGQHEAFQTSVLMDAKISELNLNLPFRPLRVDLDPEFDLFRRLNRNEMPPALSQALGSEKMLVILPSAANETLLQGYREFAKSLSRSGPDIVEVVTDSELNKIPSDSAVTILGWENRFLKEMLAALAVYDMRITGDAIHARGFSLSSENHSVVFTARNPANSDMAMAFIATDTVEAIPGLGRKLPHYHKYSYLGFKGKEPENILKGRWPVKESPVTAFVPDENGRIDKIGMGSLAAKKPLSAPPPAFSSPRMMETVRFLSDNAMKGRGPGTDELDMAAEYVSRQFREAGLQPAGDSEGSYFQEWKDQDLKMMMKNVIGYIPSRNPAKSGHTIIVGAHYDHIGTGWPDVKPENRGEIHPGADDNASGVSVLIELARVLSKNPPANKDVIFIAFTGEETGRKGSKYFIRNHRQSPSAMVNLDTVGRLGKRKLLILGAGSAKEWGHLFRGAGYVTGVDINIVQEDLDSSDHISFQEAGIPAVQFFSGPHADYHRPSDTAEAIDPEGLIKVASVAKEVIEYLASRIEPLIPSLNEHMRNPASVTKESARRKVGLGIIPDFSFAGTGCRLSGVIPGSPAEANGLREGDIVIRLNSSPVTNLKDLSEILKTLAHGARVTVVFIRNGMETSVEAEAVEK